MLTVSSQHYVLNRFHWVTLSLSYYYSRNCASIPAAAVVLQQQLQQQLLLRLQLLLAVAPRRCFVLNLCRHPQQLPTSGYCILDQHWKIYSWMLSVVRQIYCRMNNRCGFPKKLVSHRLQDSFNGRLTEHAMESYNLQLSSEATIERNHRWPWSLLLVKVQTLGLQKNASATLTDDTRMWFWSLRSKAMVFVRAF